MKEISKIECLHVISEPGDMTHYDYIVHRDGPDEFTIAPAFSTFEFPQRINYYKAKTLLDNLDNEEKLIKCADEMSCNAFTLIEVCKTVVLIWKEK